jgi:hypothetical protein
VDVLIAIKADFLTFSDKRGGIIKTLAPYIKNYIEDLERMKE